MTNQDLIKQYVDTGIGIPEYQFSRLSQNMKKTYLRKRVISNELRPITIQKWEFDLLTDEEKRRVSVSYSNATNMIPNYMFEFLSPQEIYQSTKGFIKRHLRNIKTRIYLAKIKDTESPSDDQLYYLGIITKYVHSVIPYLSEEQAGEINKMIDFEK